MYTVYILLSLKDKKMYVGCTKDFIVRFEKHTKGEVSATTHRRPLVILHTESNLKKEDAFQRERFLKSLWSARFKKKLKQKYLSQHMG